MRSAGAGGRLVPLLLVLLCGAFALRADPVTIHLAGDSTMAEKLAERRPETGWGEMLERHFRPGTVRVVNHARNGRSTRTFISEGRWEALLATLRPGDHVLIQFGHNDASVDKEDRYTPPAEYRRNLERFVAEARERGAHPVLLTPVARRRFDREGRFYDSHGEYPEIVREVAAALDVPLLDMHGSTGDLLRRLGEEESKRLFLHLAPGESENYPDGLRDDTHFSPAGAACMAALAVEALRGSEVPLAAFLRPRAGEPAGARAETCTGCEGR